MDGKHDTVSVNERASKIAEEMIRSSEELGIAVIKLKNGAIVIDAGINVRGGLKAGIYFSEVCLGGLGRVSLSMRERLCVDVNVDRPAISCMASQFAGWAVKAEGYFAMGSGPARALARVEEKLFRELKYEDRCETAVIALETRKLPNENVAEFIAQKCHVRPDNLYILVAPTASIVGSIQISARVVETGVHKLHELGFDMGKIICGSGLAPIAPVAKNDLEAMGKTNDCVLYGGRTIFFVDADDAEVKKVIDDVPSSTSKDYGMPFLELFERYNRDFFKIDPKLFSPAEIVVSNTRTGSIFRSGKVNEEILSKSLGALI